MKGENLIMQGRPIPESIIEEVKQRNEIVSVVEQYVRLEKKSAQNLFGLCPFHSEATPSFSVSPGKQIYYCFGCHKGGDVIHFMMDIEKISYIEAIKVLAEKVKIELPTSNDHEYQKKVDLQKKLYSANTEAARYFYKNLIGPQGAGARDYLKNRSIDPSTVKRFGMGYAVDEWEGLYRHLKSKGYSDDIIFLTGLFKKRANNQKISRDITASNSQSARTHSEEPPAENSSISMYDLFRNRLMFPIFDYLGRIVAFGGRVLDDSLPKYINSPETPIYIKGRHLYGFHIAKSSKAKNLIIVEGYMDAIAMHQAGVDNAVASLGTALTEQQAMLIRKHSENAIIAYDSDAAGQNATLRGLEILTKKGCKVSVLCMPEGKDPDEYIRRNGAERFIALTKDAMPLMDYKLFSAYNLSNKESTFDRIAYQDYACNILAAQENRIVRELYASVVAEKLGISIDPVLAETERRIRQKSNDADKAPVYTPQPHVVDDDIHYEITEQSKATKEELYFLCLLSSDPKIYGLMEPPIELSFFSPGLMQIIASEAIDLAKENKLTSSALVEIGSENVVNQRKLSELFASGCMKVGEDVSVKKAVEEATNLYIKMKILMYMDEKDKITKQLILKTDDLVTTEEKKKTLLLISNKISELRNRSGLK